METKPLPVCTPEAVGIPSRAVEGYVRSLVDSRLAMHDVLIARDGKLCFEAYWKPFDSSFRHRLYSCSKSYVSVAIGLLAERGALSLEDRCLDFFPDKAPKDAHPWLQAMCIRDLLRMATCYDSGASYKPEDPDWERTFFTAPISHRPGQVFSYCTTATTMLCMIIRHVAGMEFMDVLRPIFDELGVSQEAFCVETPCGHEWGGSGVCMTAREFLKFSSLCTAYGQWEGKRLLPEAYMREATSKQIDNSADHGTPDTEMGYGYQFWPMRNGGFAMHGMGGQFALCIPEKRLTLVTNAYDELGGKELINVFDAFWREIYARVSDGPLEADGAGLDRLRALAASLELPLPLGARHSPLEQAIAGKTYRMADNRLGLRSLRFEFGQCEGVLHYENARGSHALRFGLGAYVRQPFPETHYSGRRIGVPAGRGYDSLTSAAWPMDNGLAIVCQIVDIHLGNLRLSFGFDGDTVTLLARKHAEWFLTDYEGFASGQWD